MGVPLTLSSVPAQTPYVQYVSSASQTVFPYPFEITQDSDLVCLINGVTQPTDSGYTITGQGATGGGNLVFASGQTAGTIITLYRNVPIARITQLAQNGTFFSANFNNEFNKIYLIMQQLQQSLLPGGNQAYALMIPNSNNPAPTTLLTPSAYAGKYLSFDSNGNPQPAALTSSGSLTATIIATLLNGSSPQVSSLVIQTPQTGVESTAGVVPVNLFYPPGYVDRYATNTTPGTTDMGGALNLAIKQMVAGGAPVRFAAGAYYIQTAPVFSVGGTTNIVPIDIGGAGDVLTQLISGVPTGAHSAIQGGLFNMAGINGWYLHDFLMCGADTNKASAASTGPGIVVNTVGGALSTEWRIERITSMMAGHGIVCADTNTGAIKDFRHWPGNNPTLLVSQTASNANRGHGVYLTGSFAHNISMINLTVPANANYFSGVQRGINCDASFSLGCSIILPLVQSDSGLNTETGIDWNAGTSEGLSIISPYNEGAIISLKNVQNSEIIGATDGATGGSIVLASNAAFNRISACNQATITISDNTCFGNKFHNCNARSSFTDSNEADNISTVPNSFEGCNLWNGSAQVSVGTLGTSWRKILAYSASMSLDMYGPNHYVVRANNTSDMAFALAHKRNGQIIAVTIRNENASAGLGTITWTSIATPASVPSPAAGFNRTYWIEYDSDFALGYMINWSPADVAN